MAKLTITIEVDSIPSNKADFVTLVTSREDYQDRTARDEAEETP